MTKHHAESIQRMLAHYRENPEIKALFLVGSVATGTERPDSDLDGAAIVSTAYRDEKKNTDGLEEVYHGKCTYPGGYFNVHYMAREDMEQLAAKGSEPGRNMFTCARTLFCDEAGLEELAAKIPLYPKEEASRRQFRFYCTLRTLYDYFWCACKPSGFARLHTAHGMLYHLYRLILIENEILFPSARKLEEAVLGAPKKPEGFLETCRRFQGELSDEDAKALMEGYEAFTSYDYPKDKKVILNHYADPYEWE